jgi:hypothetical protein
MPSSRTTPSSRASRITSKNIGVGARGLLGVARDARDLICDPGVDPRSRKRDLGTRRKCFHFWFKVAVFCVKTAHFELKRRQNQGSLVTVLLTGLKCKPLKPFKLLGDRGAKTAPARWGGVGCGGNWGREAGRARLLLPAVPSHRRSPLMNSMHKQVLILCKVIEVVSYQLSVISYQLSVIGETPHCLAASRGVDSHLWGQGRRTVEARCSPTRSAAVGVMASRSLKQLPVSY